MQRAIVDFSTDEKDEPIAWLNCGHPQHVRHEPPFVNRPWVLQPETRQQMLGQSLNCVRCDAAEWPQTVVRFDRSIDHSEVNMPDEWQQGDATAVGVWGRIHVTEGRLHYSQNELAVEAL
ncbi:MAG: DUF3565 domain-containing protein, partial [gamma proteobacterium symbiont of Bathyaustriella thionipta]|nr:DUF3565 domain-containing protein [gamma proteobacterium symbiont of Bathyaustriella thionipta]